MEEYRMTLDEDEYSIIELYRKLPEMKKQKFLKLMASLRKILLDEKDT